MNLVNSYRSSIERFVAQELGPYLSALSDPNWVVPKAKELNDAVWQTITLTPFEVLILDSPLLQRLRSLRQLGVVHWIYPSAVHTRLEHSIGAVLQVQRLADAVNRHSLTDTTRAPNLSQEWVNLLRLSALCHDIGHGLMSHVSENALDSRADITELRLALRDTLDITKVCKLSEAAAYFMIGSPGFIDLIAKCQGLTNYNLPSRPHALVQDIILGKCVHNRFPLLHELISGPYDADKLDYMVRDSKMCGVPSVVDVPRLIQKVRLVAIKEDDMPFNLTASIRRHHTGLYFINAVSLSGARTLDELMQGRTLLFDKVYRHQKVRAVEAMIGIIIQELASCCTIPLGVLPLHIADDELLHFNLDALSKKLKLRKLPRKSAKRVSLLCRRIRERSLFRRAYAFSAYLPRDPFRHDPIQRKGLDRLLRDMDKPEKRKHLHEQIISHVERSRTLRRLEDQDLTAGLALDPPNPKSGETGQIARALLVTDAGRLIPFRDDSPESARLNDAHILARDLGFVFASPELTEDVYLATELVMRKEYGIRTPMTAMEYAKMSAERVKRLRRRLTELGYYNAYPNDLRQTPSRLEAADIRKKTNEIVKRLGRFEGISGGVGDTRAICIDQARVLAWLAQFEANDAVDGAISAVANIKLLGRQDLHDAVSAFTSRHSEFKKSYVCTLGTLKDSSAHLAYYTHDLKGELNLEPISLESALLSDDIPILFIDDFIGSGEQAKGIVMGWYGKRNRRLDEDHGPPLNQMLLEKLEKRRLGFLFTAGDPVGLENLDTQLDRFKLDSTAHIHIPSESLPRAFGSTEICYTSNKAKEAFHKECKRIGAAILATGTGKERTRYWISKRTLGYGMKAYLLAFPYNVPTQTLTVLWQTGTYRDWPWIPLLPRRPKT